MGRKRKKNKFKFTDDLPPDMLISYLKARAAARAAERKHRLGTWTTAKKQWGKAAQQVKCKECGGIVVVMPHGLDRIGEVGRPTLLGVPVFSDCEPRQ